MAKLLMLEALQDALVRQGLPAAAVARLLDELADHWEDLHSEHKEAGNVATMQEVESRLGNPRVLARAAAAEHRSTYFVGRHPIWSCLVAPVPLLLVCFAACILAVIGFAFTAEFVLGKSFGLEGKTGEEWPAFAVAIAYSVVYFLRFVPPVLATLILAWKVKQAGLSNRWLWISFCPIALIAACFLAHVQLPQATSPGSGNLTMGLNFPTQIQSLTQVIVPLAIVTYLSVMSRRRSLSIAY